MTNAITQLMDRGVDLPVPPPARPAEQEPLKVEAHTQPSCNGSRPSQIVACDLRPGPALVEVEPYYSAAGVALYHGDALAVLRQLDDASVDCAITSPPYYGQRDYGAEGQLGLEANPGDYIAKLVAVFREAKRVLKPTGSLWVNIGDTYWSGKGRPHGPDAKQKHRRFDRPQDQAGKRPWCAPKQLLLIPHRLAIAMQDDGWIVRNDNVWYKPTPMPDPARDRSALAHEYVFHFVGARRYYYDAEGVAVDTVERGRTKAPGSVWTVPTAPSRKRHPAVFPETLVRLPIRATLPARGVLLDPFCGSGTALRVARAERPGCTAIGVDISQVALEEARRELAAPGGSPHGFS